MALITLGVMSSAAVQLPATQQSDALRSERQVTVTADRLVSDRENKTATFTGHVKIVRGSSTIEADRLTLMYAENTPRNEVGRPGRSAIKRVVAEGNVRIRSEDLTATTPKAIYSRDAQTIELLGAGTRVVSGNNSITGHQILLNLEGDRLTVSSGGDSRVKAVLGPSTKK